MDTTANLIDRMVFDDPFQIACQRFRRGEGATREIALAAIQAIGAHEMLKVLKGMHALYDSLTLEAARSRIEAAHMDAQEQANSRDIGTQTNTSDR